MELFPRPSSVVYLKIFHFSSPLQFIYNIFPMNFITMCVGRTRGSGTARATCWCTPGCAAGGRAAPSSSPPPPSCARTTTASSSASSPTLPPPSTGSSSSTSPVTIYSLPVPVLRIRDDYPGSEFFPSLIQIFFFIRWSASKNFSILTQKICF